MMRVLFVNPGGDASGGAERSLALLIGGLGKRGHEIAVITLIGGNAVDAFAAAGALVLANGMEHGLGVMRRHGASLAFVSGAARTVSPAIRTARQISRLGSGFRADVIHTNGLRAHVLTPLLAGRHPIVWSLRERPPGWMARLMIRAAARAAAAITTPSSFAAMLASRCRRPVYVIENPVERPPMLDVEVARDALGIRHDRPVVAMVAHLHPTKGQHIALDAWQRLGVPRPLLILAGGDLYGDASRSYRESLRAGISQMGLEKDVILLGLVPDMASLYAACDLLIQPALYPEGFGRSTAEAQTAGVPVIATSIGATPELIEDGKSGVLVAPGDPRALAGAVSRVLHDPILLDRLRSGGIAASQRYRPEGHAAAIESVYLAVTA